MDFSEKVKRFFKDKKLNNRKACQIMDNYSETLFSKHINSKEPVPTLVFAMAKYFEDADMNYFMRTDTVEKKFKANKFDLSAKNLKLVQEIEDRLNELKLNFST